MLEFLEFFFFYINEGFLFFIQPTQVLWHSSSKIPVLGISEKGQPPEQRSSILSPQNCFMPKVCKDGDC